MNVQSVYSIGRGLPTKGERSWGMERVQRERGRVPDRLISMYSPLLWNSSSFCLFFFSLQTRLFYYLLSLSLFTAPYFSPADQPSSSLHSQIIIFLFSTSQYHWHTVTSSNSLQDLPWFSRWLVGRESVLFPLSSLYTNPSESSLHWPVPSHFLCPEPLFHASTRTFRRDLWSLFIFIRLIFDISRWLRSTILSWRRSNRLRSHHQRNGMWSKL